MPRNTRGIRGRLQRAALELYGELGFDRTTTAQIAQCANVTERIYFRHFADEREVLFDGEGALRSILTASIKEAPTTLGALDTLLQAFRATERLLEENRSFSEPRQRIIAATPALQESELAKIASLTDSLSAALEERNIDRRTTALAAKVGMAALTQAATAWLADPSRRFAMHLDAAFAGLRELSSSASSSNDGSAPQTV